MLMTDSKTAIKSLDVYTTSDLVHECRTSLNAMAAMAGQSNVVHKLVRGHVLAI